MKADDQMRMPAKLSCNVQLGAEEWPSWLKAAVLKTVRLERVSGVRIPPPPPLLKKCSKHAAICGLLLLFVMFTLIGRAVIVKTP